MKAFNPEKELYKIQNGNKNKVILFVISLLVVGVIGYSFALYQVRYSKRIIYTKVAPFSNKDIELAVYLDGEPQTSFPKQESVYYDSVTCDNDSNASARWDYDNWRLKELDVSVPNKCNLNFTKNYRDSSGANAPELYQGLIPVTYDTNGNVKVADTSKEWYNYEEKEWANAVLVSSENYSKYIKDGEYQNNIEIPMSDILQMYVWIPRYKYLLFNINGSIISAQMINIEFESGTSTTGTVKCSIDKIGNESCNNAIAGNWYTHPAFTFGNTELEGIWVSKFEMNKTGEQLQAIPNVDPYRNVNLLQKFNDAQKIELNFNLNSQEIDTHLMKSIDWGAMSFLTQSKYGRCNENGTCGTVTINSLENRTGYANSSYSWNTANGMNASSTGNIYGIYDMVGGTWEMVMGVLVNNSGTPYYNNTGFNDDNMPDQKYYDIYNGTGTITAAVGHFGDGIKETTKWHSASANFPSINYAWFKRGGRGLNDVPGGIFAIYSEKVGGDGCTSSRVVLTAQDGNN